MNSSPTRPALSSSHAGIDAEWTPRERRASRAADRQELTLRRSELRCCAADSRKYDLIYQRYDQPVAVNLDLIAVEDWLGIRGSSTS
jgi:hypothetical protein